MASFNSDIRQFRSPDDLARYLATLPPPTWGVKGTTGHNTYRPTEAQWLGQRSMESMQQGYIDKGWSAGPHLFIALGAPNPAHNGIWQMTPLTSEGVHGVSCNPTHFGVELVGDFQSRAPSAAQQVLFLDTIAVIHRWAKLGAVFNMHRDCVPRTCPGDAFYALKPQLQRGLADRLTQGDPWPARWGPVATPQGEQWAWANAVTWKSHWQRLGQCTSHLLYDDPNHVICQHFAGGVIRSLDSNQTWEVCYR